MSEYTFLTKDEVIGDNKLDVFKKRGTKAAITDFSILLGGYVLDGYHTDYGEKTLKNRTGAWWIKTDNGYNSARAVYYDGGSDSYNVYKRFLGCRPASPFSSIDKIPTNGVSGKKAKDGVLEVEYGYYPQTVAVGPMQKELHVRLKGGRLAKTGEKFVTDSRKYSEDDEKFSPQTHEVYECDGKKYVKVTANFSNGETTLSNGEKYKNGDEVWVEVEPINWLVDEKSKMMITEKLVFSGVQFTHERNYRTEDFAKTDVKKFMDEYWSRDIEQFVKETGTQENLKEEQGSGVRKSRLQKLNPDKSEAKSRAKMTDTEIIHNWIESGESVLLRGPSGIGKTERIKSLYPDLIYMKLTNNMFPEKVVGSVNLQTGQSIPPDFAKTAIMQAANDEEKKLIEENIQNIYDIADEVYERSKTSDKKVVILLDELLNVKPAVQGLVYTLVLNRMVEIGKGLKLPDNVVVVATGNQKKYSSVAEDLAEPLEKRFDHILDMEPKVGEWLTEYAIPKKVHPAVIGYMLSKYNSSGKSEAIKDIGYFYEEPEVGEEHLDSNGCRGRTNDPRGWTSISNTLYNFERNLEAGKYEGKDVEDILSRSIDSKLRTEWASEFFDFYNLPTLTPEEVAKGIGKGYTQADLPRDISERFAYMTALITADESQVESCREFIRKHCDPEYLEVFDIYWAGNDERRMEILSELQAMSQKLYTSADIKTYAQDGAEAYMIIGQMYHENLTREKEVGVK